MSKRRLGAGTRSGGGKDASRISRVSISGRRRTSSPGDTPDRAAKATYRGRTAQPLAAIKVHAVAARHTRSFAPPGPWQTRQGPDCGPHPFGQLGGSEPQGSDACLRRIAFRQALNEYRHVRDSSACRAR
jgi:hypothetical protein